MREAEAAGLRFDRAVQARLLGHPEEDVPGIEALSRQFSGGRAHDELQRVPWWRALELVPMPRKRREGDAWHRHWIVNRGRPRTLPRGAVIHESVRLRAALGLPTAQAIDGAPYAW